MASDKKTVLVVDDEPDTVTFLSTLLEDNGYEAISAADGNEALESVKSRRPDLISLDITMPEKSGVKFYREVRTDDALKDIPIVIVTGIAPDFERFISSRSQVPPPDGFVTKPIDQQRFLELVAQLTS